jgi:hypothetical protein
MNERIKEIAKQADAYAYGFTDTDPSANWYETRDQKFAELIVWECAGVAEVSMPINSHPDDRLTVKNNVLKHFGVEE